MPITEAANQRAAYTETRPMAMESQTCHSGGGNEGVEDCAVAVCHQVLRVPLYADCKWMVGDLDRFNDAIRGVGRDVECRR